MWKQALNGWLSRLGAIAGCKCRRLIRYDKRVFAAQFSGQTMTTLPLTESVSIEISPLPRPALDELYHFLQYLQFKYSADLETTLEAIEDEIDSFDADVALQEPGEISLGSLKQELGLQ